MANDKTCSKDGCDRPAARGKDAWCLECRAAYQREYTETKLVQARAAGFGDGCEAMREALVATFDAMGRAQISAGEAVGVVRQAMRPTLVRPKHVDLIPRGNVNI
jgi:hypothetical protein